MSMKEGPGFSHWITEKTSNDDLYMFEIQCRKQEFGIARQTESDLIFVGWSHLKLNEPVNRLKEID